MPGRPRVTAMQPLTGCTRLRRASPETCSAADEDQQPHASWRRRCRSGRHSRTRERSRSSARSVADRSACGRDQMQSAPRPAVSPEFRAQRRLMPAEPGGARWAPKQVFHRRTGSVMADQRRSDYPRAELAARLAHDGLPVADAARSLGVTPVAGRMRLARARRKLRAAIEASGPAARVPATN